jgi:multidrug efflux pump
MWLSDLSVRRPVFATVCNALLVVFGGFALHGITLREYPDVDPPVISVNTAYPGASAAVVETRITQRLEDHIAGLEGVRSVASSSADGNSKIVVDFNLSRDIEAAASDVRDRVARVLDELPREADAPWLDKADVDASPIMQLVLSSDRLSAIELTDYADRFVIDRFSAIDGVSRVTVPGARRKSMRIWLDPSLLTARGLAVDDVENALVRQNVERPAGRIESVDRELTLRTRREFTTAEEFSELIVTRGADGYPIRLSDLGRVEVGALQPRSVFRSDGVTAVGLSIGKQSKANTLEVARAVKAAMTDIASDLPAGMRLRVSTDDSQFIEASLSAVTRTLIEACIIVAAVIWLFLGNLRATLIPVTTVPISLISSFLFLAAMGFSLNILTMLALVLAIGLVVDDAIVVVENVHRHAEAGEPPLLAAYRGTREVGFAIVATTVVLIAVFVPLAFLQGETGRLFREFALALAGAVACSGFVSLTLCPAMAAWLLRPQTRENPLSKHLVAQIDRLADAYNSSLQALLRHRWLAASLMAAMFAGIFGLFKSLPAEITPTEDRGQFTVNVTAPQGASLEYTSRYLEIVEDLLLQDLGLGEVDRLLTRMPIAYTSADVNTGQIQVSMRDWYERKRSTADYISQLAPQLSNLPGIRAAAVQRRGFRSRSAQQPVQVVIGGSDYDQLAEWRDRLFARISRENPRIQGLESDYEETKPTLAVDIDMSRAGDLGVSVQAISSTLETLLGGKRVTTYTEGGREYEVVLQADAARRENPDDLKNVHVRSEASGSLIPLSNLITTQDTAGAATYNRFDRMRAITISAGLAADYRLGEALSYLERVVEEELPPSARLSFTGQSREFMDSAGELYTSFALAVVVVYLVLAAQFESWIHPLVIMTAVPLAIFGALAALAAFGYSLNIYTQIGIIMLIGLAAKNGILIVEFANQRRDAGAAFSAALIEAAQVRLRPILMTSIATVAGVAPLMLATGAGAEARSNLGLVVFWGVLFSTFLTLFIVPAFYALLAGRTNSPGKRAAQLAIQEGHNPALLTKS